MESPEECGCVWQALQMPKEYVRCPLCGHSIRRVGWWMHAYYHKLEGDGQIHKLDL